VTPSLWAAYSLIDLQNGWLTLAFWGTGRAIVDRFKITAENSWERTAMAFALGCGVWAMGFLLLGLAQCLFRPVLFLILTAGGLLGLFYFWRDAPEILPGFKLFKGSRSALVAGALFGIHCLMLVPYALVPETYFDSLEYHLALPRLYLLLGGIQATPDNSFSGVPNMASMLYGWGLLLDPKGAVSQLFNYSFLGWTGIALTGLALRFKRLAAGPVASMLFVFIPVVGFVSYFTQIELEWGFFQIVCLSALLALSETQKTKRSAWVYAAGFLLGTAMSAKYLAWGLPLAFIVFAWSSRREKGAFEYGEILRIAAVAAAVLAPWVLKNVFFYGNPLYPFLHTYFSDPSTWAPGTGYLGEGARLEIGTLGLQTYLYRVIAGPWRMVFYEQNPGDSLGPVLFCLLPLWFFIKADRDQLRLRGYLFGCVAPLLFVTDLPRFYIPSFGLAALAFSLPVFDVKERAVRAGILGVLFAGVLGLGFCVWRWVLPRSRWPVFTGAISRSEFLSNANRQYYPSPSYAGREYLNSTPHQVTVLERWANQSGSGKALKAKMAKEGITYILVNHAEIIRQQKSFKFTLKGKRSFDQFWEKYTEKVHQIGPTAFSDGGKASLNRWVVVYRILSEREALLPHETDALFSAYKAKI
jgi:hypothetical protein